MTELAELLEASVELVDEYGPDVLRNVVPKEKLPTDGQLWKVNTELDLLIKQRTRSIR